MRTYSLACAMLNSGSNKKELRVKLLFYLYQLKKLIMTAAKNNAPQTDAKEKITDIHKTYSVAQKREYDLVLNYTSCYLSTCFPPIYAGLPAHEINNDTQSALAEYTDGPLGVLVCDFMTSELAGAIIGRNFK